MKFYLNGCETEAAIEPDETVCDFVGRVSRTRLPEGQMVLQVKVDGELTLWSGDGKPAVSCASLEMVTASARDVLISGLLDAYKLCPAFQETLRVLADELGTYKQKKALAKLAEAMETFTWLYSVISGAERLLGVSKKGSASASMRAPKTILQSMAEALKEENFVVVSDIARYELIPCVDELQKVLAFFIKETDKKLLTLS